jgi:CubicO group peptidase (beta-lactamase class C family)
VLSLVEDGLLDLHGPVEELLPELAGRRVLRHPDGPLDDTVKAERPLTVRDLLTFTWGFGMQSHVRPQDGHFQSVISGASSPCSRV